MTRISPTRKIATLAGILALVGGGFAVYAGTSQAAEDCGGLDTALRNNENFIAGQQANPDAQSEARIANRQAVVDLIQQRRDAAGCTGSGSNNDNNDGNGQSRSSRQGSGESCAGLDKALQNNLNFIAGQQADPDAQSEARIANRQAVVDLIEQRRDAAGCDEDIQVDEPENANGNDDADNNDGANNNDDGANNDDANNEDVDKGNGNNGGNGDVVCDNQNITLTGDGGAPAASSGEFPIGTKLSVTNLDNDQEITVEVTSVSGSCVLLNAAAFEEVREAGKNVIRNNIVRRVG